jgi:hypothetical protein
MTVILMSRSEIDRMNVLRDLAEERIRVSEAATLIGLGRRQVLRLAKAFRQRGPAALASRRRGKPSNRSYPGVLRTEVTGIIRECYADFGPTLAGEKLAELHGIRLARETIRQWMMVAGLWKDRRQRMRPVHQPRHRRDCIGELIQIDGSQHWWFEGRGPQCTLLVYIDDATSRLMHLQFVETESTFDYFEATRAYLDRYGKPIAFYSDKHAVFRVIQDRLVKEMRLRSIDTVAAGNAFLPIFMADYNTRFAKAPFDERDLHRPLVGDDDLDDAFAWKEDRTVSKNLTLQYDKVLFILEPNEITRSLACKRVMILDYPDGRFAIRHNGVDLPYRTFDKRPQVNQAAIVENKRLGPVLAYIAEKQKELDMSRSAKAPRRRGQRNHMFKVG